MTHYVLHWRSISTYNEGVSTMLITDRELAHRLIGGLNDLPSMSKSLIIESHAASGTSARTSRRRRRMVVEQGIVPGVAGA